MPHGPGVQDLVEQQILRWQELQRERREEEKAREAPPPVITLSREVWSRGTQLGRLIAKQLDYQFWDQEVVHRIAEETGSQEAFLRALDEHSRGVVEDLVAGVLAGDAFTRSEYTTHLLRVMHAIARYGRAVIIGRGAQFVLPPEAALRVRVVCSAELRAKNFAETRGGTDKEARAEIDRIERDRRAFIQQQFKADVTDPTHYDLVVNTGKLTLDQCAEVVLRAYDVKFGRKRTRSSVE
jgi:cytidylate kinase